MFLKALPFYLIRATSIQVVQPQDRFICVMLIFMFPLPRTQTLFKTCVLGAVIPIQSPTLWPLPNMTGVFKMYASSIVSSDGQWHQDTAILGQLTPMFPIKKHVLVSVQETQVLACWRHRAFLTEQFSSTPADSSNIRIE